MPGNSGIFGRAGRYRCEHNRLFQDFRLLPHDGLLKKLVTSAVDSRVLVCSREFVVCRTYGVRVGGQLSKEAIVTSSVPQGSVLSQLRFLVYINDI